MSPVDSYVVSPATLKPLMQAFWSPQGWRLPPTLPVGDDLVRAVESGLMFADPVHRDHDGWVDAARRAVGAIQLNEVADAFVSSLASRRLDLRSALGSYAVARHLPEHEFAAGRSPYLCGVCGLSDDPEPQDLNVLSFERFKWGGVRRDNPIYLAFDLEQFQLAPRPPLDESAIALGHELLDALRAVPPSETATAAIPRLRIVKGNAAERATLLDILGVCGVLGTAEHPGYLSSFIPYDQRALPPHHFVDRAYPVCWWRGGDGVNPAALRHFLPRLA